MASATREVLPDRKSMFGFESSPNASRLFASFHGSIILKGRKLAYL
jgi:hypothetical protein